MTSAVTETAALNTRIVYNKWSDFPRELAIFFAYHKASRNTGVAKPDMRTARHFVHMKRQGRTIYRYRYQPHKVQSRYQVTFVVQPHANKTHYQTCRRRQDPP
jgi:hypothetical protein